MAEIRILPATADHFDEVEHALSGGGDGRSCQCQWWLLTSKDFSSTSTQDRMRLLHDETRGSLPPGLVAEVDDQAAGWVRVGPRSILRRMARSRIYGPHVTVDGDDDVWAVSCFSVRREFRGQHITGTLLEAAVDFARSHGARVVEGYPRDTSVARISANDLFPGALSTFLAAGFVETARPRPDRPIVAQELA